MSICSETVKCENCGKIHEIDLKVINTYYGEERQMGPEEFFVLEGDKDCDCGQQMIVTGTGWSYPATGEMEDWTTDDCEGCNTFEDE